MSSYKTVNTDYTLTCNNGNGVFTVNAQTNFLGNVTYNVPAVSVAPFITVAANNNGSYTTMGLLGQTGPSTFAGIRFNSTANAWEVSSNVTSTGYAITPYANVLQKPGGVTGSLQINGAGTFVGSPNLVFNPVGNILGLFGSQYFGYQPRPSDLAGNVAVYSNVAGDGNTGLYFTSSSNSGELVSATKAKLYAIIF